jgi:hypothetical protein
MVLMWSAALNAAGHLHLNSVLAHSRASSRRILDEPLAMAIATMPDLTA